MTTSSSSLPTEIDKQQAAALLDHWLGEPDEGPRLQVWFDGTAPHDALLAQRFGALHARAAAGELDAWLETPSGALALVILRDQLSRNLHRGTAQMFAQDAAARAAARVVLAAGAGEGISPAARAVALVCLMHAEDADVVREAVAGLDALARDPVTRLHRKAYKRLRSSARQHLRVLERFGRYPHRNALLGRETTAEEALHLEADQSRYTRSVQPHVPAQGRLKILVLHSFRQSGARLAARTAGLRRALEDIAELIYVDAPHPYAPDDAERALLEEDFGVVPDFSTQRCWWNAEGEQTEHYTGWEESLRALDARIRAEAPDGVLGFSQGAAVTGLLAALRAEQLRFVICVSGFPSRARAHDMLTRPDSIALPSLHIYGENDVLMDRSRTLALAACFRDAEVIGHPGGHFAPEQWPLDAVRRFLLRFIEAPAPPPRAQLADPAWAAALQADAQDPACLPSPEDLRSRLPRNPEVLQALLAEARGHRREPRYGGVQDVGAPLRGDLAHRIWLAAWLQAPDVVRAHLQQEDHWTALVRLAVCATALLPPDAHTPLREAIAERFVAQLRADEARVPQTPSRAAEAAPRPDAAVNRACTLGRLIADRLEPDVAGTPAAYIRYRRRLVALARLSRAARKPRPRRPRGQAMPMPEPTAEVVRPRPVPVIPCAPEELSPLLEHLSASTAILTPRQFPRGTLLPDGRLDLCKQVVGPQGIGPLLTSLAAHPQVDRLLLGNNIVGPVGAQEIVSFLRAGLSRLKVWYIAGNELTAGDLAPICAALEVDPFVEALWLKRNPLGPEAGAPLARLLRADTRIHTLDLVNTGLLDAGAEEVIAALHDNHALRHLYLGTNGLSAAVGAALGRYLAEVDRLESLYVSCNRLGDAGVAALAEGLARSRRLVRLGLASNGIQVAGMRALRAALADNTSLRFLDLGWTRATVAVGEGNNLLGDAGAAELGLLLRENHTLRALDVSHNNISQAGLNHLCDALETNQTLVFLRHPQHGKATNPDAIARLRGRLARNRRRWGVDEAAVEQLRAPDAARDVLSVYRTRPIPLGPEDATERNPRHTTAPGH